MRKVTSIGLLLLTCMILSGCMASELKETAYDEDFVITDFDAYVENLFGITDAVYNYDNVADLYPLLKNYMSNLNLSYDNNELKELGYHVLEKAPTYIDTQESNIRTVITLEYILANYRDMELTEDEKKLRRALRGVRGFYLHTFTGSEVSSEKVMKRLNRSNEIHTELKEKDFYAKR